MAKYSGYNLNVTYKLRVRSARQAQRVSDVEAGLLDELSFAAIKHGGWRGRPLFRSQVSADYFEYDSASKRRIVGWTIRSSRQARAAEKLIKRLRRTYRKMDIKTNVKYFTQDDQEESLLDEAKKYLITHGQYKALMREGAARTCLECHQCIPKYSGRYPKNCPDCGGNVGNPIEAAVESIVVGESVGTIVANLVAEGAPEDIRDKVKSGARAASDWAKGKPKPDADWQDKAAYHGGRALKWAKKNPGKTAAIVGGAAALELGAGYLAHKRRELKQKERHHRERTDV